MSSRKRTRSDGGSMITKIDELFKGNVLSHRKLEPKNPMLEKVGVVDIYVPNKGISEIFTKLYPVDQENPLKTEIKNYCSEIMGETKTYFGEYCFEETIQTVLRLVYEKEKEDKLEAFLDERCPEWGYVFRKSK